MPPQMPQIDFDPALPILKEQITARQYTAICGANNSGKSLVLKRLKQSIGREAYLAGSARFYHVHTLNSSMRKTDEYRTYENSFNQNVNNHEHNFDQNTIGLERILTNLSNHRRENLFALCGELIGNTFSLKHFEDDNIMSPFYVDMDGQNLAVGSSGTRLLMTLIGLCMDENFRCLLIDEPELGLGPRVQLKLSRFFADPEKRKKYFPHLSTIVVATHSNLFLDMININGNFSVRKNGARVSVRQIEDFSELHNLQFNLLGNSLESLFLPAGFIFVEGKTDLPYIDRLVKTHTNSRNIVVLQSNGDVKGRVHQLKESLHDIYKSPFRSRIFAVLDSVVPNPSLKRDLEVMGLLPENIIQWSSNGIEHMYPSSIVSAVFSCGENRVKELVITHDVVSLNGISLKKSELSDRVCEMLSKDTQLPSELEQKLWGWPR